MRWATQADRQAAGETADCLSACVAKRSGVGAKPWEGLLGTGLISLGQYLLTEATSSTSSLFLGLADLL